MKSPRKNLKTRGLLKLDWRIAWYAVFVWLTAFILSGFVILPWFYLVFPAALWVVTFFYFERIRLNYLKRRLKILPSGIFAQGLFIGLFWFLVLVVLDFVQLVGFDSSSASIYFLDPRNFIKYPIVILLPVIYGLVLENEKNKKRYTEKRGLFTSGVVRFR